MLFADSVLLFTNSVLLSTAVAVVLQNPTDRKPRPVCIWSILHELSHEAEALCQAYVESQTNMYVWLLCWMLLSWY